MRQSGKEAKLQRMQLEGQSPDRREALALQANAEFADELGHDARIGGGFARRHPPAGRG
ncbi:hypothetical protein COLU111180_05540 [Cohnella lubricantis]|uniref:Uncharacterized protein n=1 Tax=Cohnella lubricantis TaxID=2163172 RepID=A0A841TEB5_9BACL|nr:hypothetical protein [Cohnella lubricantis]MBB6677658.1 hypothetical protein [Cohnella lubricantis]MBP2116454.1 hypothetical protein [Cohnella lubricantis]